MKNTEYQIPGPADGQLRFKTEQEFEQEFGKSWRVTHWVNEQKDYLFGLPVKEQWVGRFEIMHHDKCPHGDAEWYCYPEQLTRHPLPDAEPAKPREHWVGQEGTLPDGTVVEIKGILLDGDLFVNGTWVSPRETHWYHKAAYQAITWDWDKPEPSIYERFPIGKRFMVEVEVAEHDKNDSDYPIRVRHSWELHGTWLAPDDLPKD